MSSAAGSCLEGPGLTFIRGKTRGSGGEAQSLVRTESPGDSLEKAGTRASCGSDCKDRPGGRDFCPVCLDSQLWAQSPGARRTWSPGPHLPAT